MGVKKLEIITILITAILVMISVLVGGLCVLLFKEERVFLKKETRIEEQINEKRMRDEEKQWINLLSYTGKEQKDYDSE